MKLQNTTFIIVSHVFVTLDAGLALWVDLLDMHKAELQLTVTL
jgi:hypothetical protein